jgi:hypothetical protein
MDLIGFQSGWVSDPQRVDEIVAMRTERGDAVLDVSFAANYRLDLAGTWQRAKSQGYTGIFLRDRESVLLARPGDPLELKRYRRPFLQKFGTCVSRGMCRGVQTTFDAAIVDRSLLLRPSEFTFAPIYSLARHECGHDRCGSGDGAILADAATAVHDFGVATTDLFKGMSEDDVERDAVRYAAPGVGTPAMWIAASRGHTCVTFLPQQLEMIFDCIAAGYAVPYAMSYVTAKPNKYGISGLGSYGPHCRCFVGVFVDENGETQLESSESWGRFPAGDPTTSDQTMPVEQMPCVELHYAGGVRKLAPGDVGVNAKSFYAQIRSGGEAWAVGPAKHEATSVADALSGKSSVA